ncbi:hypothetical protein SUGI_0490700 [Cryptomeria japonica]|uniref:36.4 kDa proline-rich protein n=1 Tax=Cryptomeria japonica TaxID=3369 RepID=UPI002408CD66|nr:36.4 kDa proline-rich protein [Cryptomeria japonica]GLJ25614.1 hypothetical protein SUGI_0490700 [Cryptomeria japonica]
MMMKKAVALMLIVMVEVAMAHGGYKYPPTPKTPKTPSTPGTGKTPPSGGGTSGQCPIDALKLGACVDLLSGLVHVGLGDPVTNQCCPLIQGVAALEVALCLCTTIRVKLLNLNVILPVALSLVASCGLTVPPGFKCPA